MAVADRRRELGALGERIAAEHLERLGYRILERNARTRRGELDLIAADRAALVFVEVRTIRRGNARGPLRPLDSIGPRKRAQVRMLAREWLAGGGGGGRGFATIRFDAVGVVVDGNQRPVEVEHLRAAF